MAWFNLNDGLSNLKGQLTNFANGVLTDGIVNNDKDENDDESLNKNKDKEKILRLEQEVERLTQVLATHNLLKDKQNENDTTSQSSKEWSWNVPQDQQDDNTSESMMMIKRLNEKIKLLEFEKQDLIQSLENLDLDCQQTTDKLITLKDKVQTDYNELKAQYGDLKRMNDNLTKNNQLSVKKIQEISSENERMKILETELQEKMKTLLNRDVDDANIEHISPNKELQELRIKNDNLEVIIANLTSENANIRKEYDKTAILMQDQEENLKRQQETVIKLQNEKETLENKLRQQQESQKTSQQIQNLEEKTEHLTQLNESFSKENQTQTNAKQANNLEDESEKLIENNKKLEGEILKLKERNRETINSMKINYDIELKSHLAETNKTFEKVILKEFRENLQKFVDYNLDMKENDENYKKLIENVLKLILDYKWKNETLEKELYELTQEKTKILQEKNHEIEKLLQNSEILSQEVVTKTEQLKHYEIECNDLMKNNDLLINELEIHKNNTSTGLQTISESNEDNMLLLESQLENANQRIKDLELEIETLRQDTNVELQTELEYIKKQLNLTGTELSVTQQNLKDVQLNYNKLDEQHKALLSDNERLTTEKNDLSAVVNKLTNDFENTEYKCNEMNADMEHLLEENESKQKHLDVMSATNKKLEFLNQNIETKSELLENEVDNLKKELTDEIESKRLLDVQISNLNEKLQNAKMAETSLKLQYDNVCKEFAYLTENKNNVEENLTFTINELKTKLNNLEEENNQMAANNLMKIQELTTKNVELNDQHENANRKCEELKRAHQEMTEENLKLILNVENLTRRIADQNATDENKESLMNLENITKENVDLKSKLEELNGQLNQMIQVVKTKHQENVEYHNEIQRLILIINTEKSNNKQLQEQLVNIQSSQTNEPTFNEEIVKIQDENKKLNERSEKSNEQNVFLREKCEILARNLLEEQSNYQKTLNERNEKELLLTKELDRLKSHLIEVEDMYTKELLTCEQKNDVLQTKINEIEQREKTSSNMYTSVSIRANQQVETLQNQLQLVTNQRDEFRKKISESDDHIAKQNAALTNLQLVLEQFQKEKENIVYQETERIRREITKEKSVQDELRKEIGSLNNQLQESKQGLQAAYRLTNQLESAQQQNCNLKDELQKLKENFVKLEEKNKKLTSQTGSKVDKMLVKNLIVGLVSSNNNLNKDQLQILKIISTVLDFTEEDNEKINRPNQSSWLNSLLHPHYHNINNNATTMNQESLSQAFVRFLENESKPRVLPNLLDTTNLDKSNTASNTPRSTPPLLSAVVLPSFSDFGQSRNSSSILKDVLKDNS